MEESHENEKNLQQGESIEQDVKELSLQIKDLLEQWHNVGQQLLQKTEHIERDLVQKIAKNQTQKEAFEKLYEEMRQYKENFVRSATKPLVLDIILLFDNIVRNEKRIEDPKACTALADLREEVEEILYRRDVELIKEESKTLQRKWQRAIKRIPTQKQEEENEVIEVIREGFLWEKTILRPQEVAIKKYQPKENKHE